MSEPIERTGALKKQVEDVIRVQKAILEAIQAIENDREREYMPPGEYHGIKFE